MAVAGEDPLADIRAGFFQECEELVEALNDAISLMAKPGADVDEQTHAAFRAVHSIKGGAAAFSLDALTAYAHDVETDLSALRGTKPSQTQISALERAGDQLAVLIARAQSEEDADTSERSPSTTAASAPGQTTGALTLRCRLETGDVLRALAAHGCVVTSPNMVTLPDLDAFLQSGSRLTFDATYTVDATPNVVETLLAGHSAAIVPTTLPPPSSAPTPTPRAIAKPQNTGAIKQPTIRVTLDRVDELVNLVGELVINQSILSRAAGNIGFAENSQISERLEDIAALTRDIQDSVMKIRAQPVKPLFQRMARICREASDLAGKSVSLVTEGQETEIDKTVIERLQDPLTHMIRNAVDHAIEPPALRQSRGKPETGTVTLRAFHRSGQVVIELSDDGAGIDRQRIREKAVQSGLIAPSADLTDPELDQLLFAPGLSTSDGISALSGRGVGMDVVREAIQRMGGRIAIDTSPGQGTRFEIVLPLTLAVLEAMTAKVAEHMLVLPLSAIREAVLIDEAKCIPIGTGRALRHGERAFALVDVGARLGYRAARSRIQDCVAMIIDREDQAPVALLFDDIVEQQQVVIKGLQSGIEMPGCISGATILGDGRVAFILDPHHDSLSPDLGGPVSGSAPLRSVA